MGRKLSKKAKYLTIMGIYNSIVKKAGEYAPYLSKGYYIDNTIHECKNQGIAGISRTTIYKALKKSQKLEKDKHFILTDDEY